MTLSTILKKKIFHYRNETFERPTYNHWSTFAEKEGKNEKNHRGHPIIIFPGSQSRRWSGTLRNISQFNESMPCNRGSKYRKANPSVSNGGVARSLKKKREKEQLNYSVESVFLRRADSLCQKLHSARLRRRYREAFEPNDCFSFRWKRERRVKSAQFQKKQGRFAGIETRR